MMKIRTNTGKNEKGKFTVEWISAKELCDRIKDPLHKLIFDRFTTDQIYAGEGILFNSGEFSD